MVSICAAPRKHADAIQPARGWQKSSLAEFVAQKNRQ
jgi:hypothetical protein